MRRIRSGILALLPIVSFAAFPALTLLAQNPEEARPEMLAHPVAFLSALGILVWLFIAAITKKPKAAAVIVSVLLLLSFSFQHLADAFRLPIGKDLSFVVWCIGLFGASWLAMHSRFGKLAFQVILGMGLVLVLMSGIRVIWQQLNKDHRAVNPFDLHLVVPPTSKAAENLPDVYFLIFDRYANEPNLQRYVGLDNTPFLDALTERGFQVDPTSRSNYPITLLSLASTLNFDFHNDLVEQYGTGNAPAEPLYEKLGQSAVARAFQSQGYQYIHVGSWWTPTRTSPIADINLTLTTVSDFSIMLYENSVFPFLTDRFHLSQFGFHDLFRRTVHAAQAKYQFSALEQIPKDPEPTFTFAHMLLPHRPYVFNADGTEVSISEGAKRGGIVNYRNQIQYANTRIVELVDRLIAASPEPPLIILQADEGPYPARYNDNGDEYSLSWSDATDEELRLKTGILNAWYLPEKYRAQGRIPHTPVNTFREVFRLLFGADLPWRPDTTYIYPDKRQPYRFIDVTDRMSTELPDCLIDDGCFSDQNPGVEADH